MIIDGNILNAAAPLSKMIDGLGKTPLLAQPGTRWSYSIGVDVQGYLIEKFSGMTFADFARTRIFEPLGMKDTGFYVPAEKVSRLALIHSEDATTGKLNPPENGRIRRLFRWPFRRRRTLFDGRRLRAVLRNAARRRSVQGHATAGATNGRDDADESRDADPLKTMALGTGWGLDFNVVMDAAMAGESTPTAPSIGSASTAHGSGSIPSTTWHLWG
jgi:CubicO group peptidase (beta-lactamase class C family)